MNLRQFLRSAEVAAAILLGAGGSRDLGPADAMIGLTQAVARLLDLDVDFRQRLHDARPALGHRGDMMRRAAGGFGRFLLTVQLGLLLVQGLGQALESGDLLPALFKLPTEGCLDMVGGFHAPILAPAHADARAKPTPHSERLVNSVAKGSQSFRPNVAASGSPDRHRTIIAAPA